MLKDCGARGAVRKQPHGNTGLRFVGRMDALMARQPKLNPDKALIFRITHRENLPWILRNGISCRSGNAQDPNFRRIGNPELIEARRDRPVPIPPGGTLADYVPFYFTPFSPMVLNIKTGYGGIPQQANDDIVILVFSLRRAEQDGLRFVFTNRHAYLAAPSISTIWRTSAKSIGISSSAATSSGTRRTRTSSSAIRRRRWCMRTFPRAASLASSATRRH